MGLSVGELVAYLRVTGTGNAARELGKVDASFVGTAESAARAGAAIDKSAFALGNAGREARVAAAGSAKHRAAQLTALSATERYNAALNQQGATLGRLAAAEAAVIRANERVAATAPGAMLMTTSAAGVKAEQGMSKAASGIGRAVKSAAGLGAAFGAFELAKQALDIGRETNIFEASMVRIQTLTSATDRDMAGMREALLGMAGEVAASPDELATSLYHMMAIGLRGKAALDGVRAAAEGAKVGNADLEDTTNALTSTVASGIVKTENFSDVMGDLLTVVGSGDMTLQQLNEALGTGMLAKVQGYGVTIKDVGAVLAAFGDQNVRGADAATQLRMAVESLAKPSAGGVQALAKIGLDADDLRKTMREKGLIAAVDQLNGRLHASGVTGKRVGGVLLDIFSKKGSQGLNQIVQVMERVHSKEAELDHGALTMSERWAKVTSTAKFAFSSLGHQAEAAGISMIEHAEPAAAGLARMLGNVLPAAVDTARGAAQPFIAGWHVLGAVLGPVAGWIGDVVREAGPLVPVLKAGGGAALSMWLAFHGFKIARTLVLGLVDGVQLLAGRSVSAFLTAQTAVTGFSTTMSLSSLKAEADALAVAAATQTEAAEVALAKYVEAEAYAEAVLASEAASASMIAASQNAALAAEEQAIAAEAAAVQTVAAADVAAEGVAAAGATARVGWASMLGPLGLAAVGVMAMVTIFGRSKSASKQATEAAKAYSEALSSGGSEAQRNAQVVDAAMSKLKDNGVVEDLKKVNDGQKDNIATGDQMVTAITKRGTALSTLKGKLQAVVEAETEANGASGTAAANAGYSATHLTERGKAAQRLIDQLNVQSGALSEATQKELDNAKAFHITATSIDQVAQTSEVGSEAAKTYASMMGIVVDKNGVAAVSAKTLNAAINTVSSAYDTASAAGSEYLGAVQTFAKSQGTSADRAALIAATLKAANGDALSHASAMNAAAVADRQFFTNVASNADNAKKSNLDYLRSVINLKTGQIDYANTAAGPVISDLQQMQTAAMGAASAAFQHARATRSGKDAADEAYKVYVSQTRGQFIDADGKLTNQARKIGLNKSQAKALADEYFGMPDQVKTLIQQQGANPVLDVLNRIGALLARLTGQPWTPTVGVNDNASAPLNSLQGRLDALAGKHVVVTTELRTIHSADHKASQPGLNRARGGPIGRATGGDVGKVRGPGSSTGDKVPAMAYDSSGSPVQEYRLSPGEWISNAKSTERNQAALDAGNRGAVLGVVKLATGGHVGGKAKKKSSSEVHKDGDDWVFRGKRFASKRAALNAEDSAHTKSKKSKSKASEERVTSALGAVGTAPAAPRIDLDQVSIGRVRQQISRAETELRTQIAKGLNAKARRHARAELRELRREANRALTNLRVKVRGADMAALRKGFAGSADDLRTAIEQTTKDMRNAGASKATMTRLGVLGRGLMTKQDQLAKGRERYKEIAGYRTSVGDTLMNSYDPGKFGSYEDFIGGQQDQRAANTRYTTEMRTLDKKIGNDKTLEALVNELAEKGNTVGLETLAGMSKAQLANVSKQQKLLNTSRLAAGDAAAVVKFGSTVGQQGAAVATMVTEQKRLLSSVNALAVGMARYAGKKQHVSVKLDGHTLAKVLIARPELHGFLAGLITDLDHHTKNGHKG